MAKTKKNVILSIMDIPYLFALAFAVVCMMVVFYLAWRFFLKYWSGGRPLRKKKAPGGKIPCPLCGSKLYAGENLVARVYKPATMNDEPCTIHGCPHCYPRPEPGLKRICPVCHQEVPFEGHLDAHLFTRRSGKKHVHVTGCTECHKKKHRV